MDKLVPFSHIADGSTPNSSISLRVRSDNSYLRFEVEGELDALSAPILRAALERGVAAGNADLVVDTSGVTFIDSSALGVFISLRQTLQARGRALHVVKQSERVRQLLDVTGLQQTFA